MPGRCMVRTLSAACAAACLIFGSASPSAGHSAKFADDYEGYHLRPPYYIKGVGWHYPPAHRISRAYYFGYHHHPTAGPLVYPGKVVYVVRRPSAREWCQARYRSYRAYDNSYQPRHGPRHQCCPPLR